MTVMPSMASSARAALGLVTILCVRREQGRGGEQGAFQAQIAARRSVPFRRRVCSAAMAARADRDRRNPHGERDIGVGGGAIGTGANSEMGIHGAQGQQQGRVVFQLAGRAAADLANLRRDLAADSA